MTMARIAQPDANWAGADDTLEGQGPGVAGGLARKAIGTMKPVVSAPGRMAQKPSLDGHTTSGLDMAMQIQANAEHPVK